jgi:hypothetical protein
MKNFNKGMKNCLGMLIGFLLLPAMLSGQQCDQLDMDLTPTNWTTDRKFAQYTALHECYS